MVVEYKCPWKHKDLHPKQAFLTHEIGGLEKNNRFLLASSSPYYYQIQTQMFVAELSLCDFVVWTNQGIYTLQVSYNAEFMANVCKKLELFWLAEILPCLMAEVPRNFESSLHGRSNFKIFT